MAIHEVFKDVEPKRALLVLNELGRGGYAVVKHGVLLEEGSTTPVAFKPVTYHGDDERANWDFAVLEHEKIMLRKLASRTRHGVPPSPRLIMSINDFERGDGADPQTPEAALVMELLPPDLTKQIKEQPNERFSIEGSLQITKNILYSLESLHQVGHATPTPYEDFTPVVHGDVKPKNISLSADGKTTLMDFGLSSDALTPLDQSTFVAVTPNFMDAGQLQGIAADERSDIYGVGMTLFYLLTGKMLGDLIKEKGTVDKNIVASKIKYSVIRGEHHQLMLDELERLEITREAYPQLIDFLLTLTHPDRSQRPQNAYEARLIAEKLLSPRELPEQEINDAVSPVSDGLVAKVAASLRSFFSAH